MSSEYSKQQNKKVACVQPPSPNKLQKGRLVIFYSLGNRGYSLFSPDHNAVKYDVQKRKDTSIIVIVLERGRGLFYLFIYFFFGGGRGVYIKINTQKLNLAVKVQLAGYRIHKKLICPEHFADNTANITRRLPNKMICSKEIIVLGRPRFR